MTDPTAPASWSAVLDELEAGLALDPRELPVPADPPAGPEWAPPAGLGQMPDELRGRAERVLASLDARHAELAALAVEVHAELGALAPTGPAARPSHRTVVHAEVPAPRLVDHDA